MADMAIKITGVPGKKVVLEIDLSKAKDAPLSSTGVTKLVGSLQTRIDEYLPGTKLNCIVSQKV